MDESRLSHFQTRFREFIYTGQYQHELAAQIQTNGKSTAAEQLDIYRHAYFSRLEQALAHDFPVTEAVLGKRAFAQSAADYVLNQPSRSPSLRHLGSGFSSWLGQYKTPALSELAAIEWAALNVFDGPDVVAAPPDSLQSFRPEDWPGLHIELMPSLELLELGSNADSVWLAKGIDAELVRRPIRAIAIWRGQSFQPMIQEIDVGVYAVLNALKANPGLSAASEWLVRTTEPLTVPQHIAKALHHALAYGWVSMIEIDEVKA